MSMFRADVAVTHSMVDRIVGRAREAGVSGERLAMLDDVLRRSVPPREPGDDEDESDDTDDGATVTVGDALAARPAKERGDGAGRRRLAALVDAGE